MIAIIAVLLFAIGAVLYVGLDINFSQGAAVFVATEEGNEEQTATVPSDESDSKIDRQNDLSKKIAKLGNTIIAAATPEETVEPTPQEEESAGDTLATAPDEENEHRCGNYHNGGAGWSASGLRIDEVEGGRLIYREVAGEPLASTSEPVVTKDIVLQLPIRSTRLANNSCISTDVIGIAKDGSLIRNTEASVYQVFGPDTLVGYALDGFPIYGASSLSTDECGGTLVNGQYRYQISTARDRIINCYAGAPVTI